MQLCKLGAVKEVTGCDAGYLTQYYDDWIEELYPYCIAILDKRRDDMKQR